MKPRQLFALLGIGVIFLRGYKKRKQLSNPADSTSYHYSDNKVIADTSTPSILEIKKWEGFTLFSTVTVN